MTAGTVSTCPRMLKAADALTGAGYGVRVVSATFDGWTAVADQHVRETRTWRSTVVDYARGTAPATAILTGLRWRVATTIARWAGPDAAPWWAVTRASSRAHPEIVRAALAEPADFFYGGTTGGLAATAAAARIAGRPYALDLEDWHSGESVADDPALQNGMAARIEARVLGDAAFLTAGSAAIANAYNARYGTRAVAVHNVFRLPPEPPVLDVEGARLRVCWFGQTIGPNRGLEEIADVAAAATVPIDLQIRGRVMPGFDAALRARVVSAPLLQLGFLDPCDPDALLDWCRGFHVGMYADPLVSENRSLCVSNKLCTYLLAGLAVVAIDAPGQRQVAADAADGVVLYPSGEIVRGAEALRRWSADRAALAQARRASWHAAEARWHWEHPEERGRLIDLVAGVFA